MTENNGMKEVWEHEDNVCISYSTNWMGPINSDWIAKHGEHWAGGRIDIYGVPGEHYPIEYGLSPMHVEDWNALSDFLDSIETTRLLEYEELIEMFENDYGKKIRWADES